MEYYPKNYSELKRNIVIFICTFDPYGEDRHIYTFENRCVQNPDISLEDATQKIVLNTKGKIDDVPKSLKLFLDYIETDIAEDEYTKEVDEAVVEIQNDERWRESIMTVDQVIKDAANAAAEESLTKGIEIGFDKGTKNNKRETAMRMLNQGDFSDDIICKMVDITSDELEIIKNDLLSEKG